MNVFLGMLEGQAMLAFLGVLVVSGVVVFKGWQRYRRPPMDYQERSPVRYLPEQSSRPAVPMLGLSPRRNVPPQ